VFFESPPPTLLIPVSVFTAREPLRPSPPY
jgi:hypothetical protein